MPTITEYFWRYHGVDNCLQKAIILETANITYYNKNNNDYITKQYLLLEGANTPSVELKKDNFQKIYDYFIGDVDIID